MQVNDLPQHASVVVLGGGVMGCSTLYHLAEAGVHDAILLERNQLTSGTTWHSAAQVRALRSTRNLTDLVRYSVDLYARLEAETGQSVGWIQEGSLSIATQPDRLVHIKRQQSLAKMYGIAAQYLCADEAGDRWPLMRADDVLGAVWSPDDGRVSPSDLCAALVKGARAWGAQIYEQTGVIGIVTEGSRIVAVETDRGRVRCDALAICAGLWSREVGAMAGVDIPLWPCEHFYLLTDALEGVRGNLPTLSDHDSHLYIRDDSGGLLVGCFEPHARAIDPERLGPDFAFQLLDEDWDHFGPMMEKALHRLPALADAGVKMLLNGPESFTPDGSFLLGESVQTRGLFMGCGMNSVGVATGGGAGRALAHCIVHGHTPSALHEADPSRFAACFQSARALAERAPEVLGKHYEIAYPARQWSSARNLQTLALHARWQRDGARFTQVYGYERPQYFGAHQHPQLREPELSFERPVCFDQVGREVMQAHRGAALFDQSSFGKFDLRGADACRFLNRVCTQQMDRPVGSVIYTLMLNERGGIESDLCAVRTAADSYRLFVGTSARKRDLAWLCRQRAAGEQVVIEDCSEALAILSLMGPKSGDLMAAVGASWPQELGYFQSAEGDVLGAPVRASRLSYVGEAGWEICCSTEQVTDLYDAFRAAGAEPSGLLAQSAMRIEKGFLAYGHDMDTDLNPMQAKLAFCLDWDTAFVGREALLAERQRRPQQRIVTLLLEDEQSVPLGNEPVLFEGQIVAQTTSAAYGYRIERPLALALLDSVVSDGARVQLELACELYAARVSEKAAFDPAGCRMRSA